MELNVAAAIDLGRIGGVEEAAVDIAACADAMVLDCRR